MTRLHTYDVPTVAIACGVIYLRIIKFGKLNPKEVPYAQLTAQINRFSWKGVLRFSNHIPQPIIYMTNFIIHLRLNLSYPIICDSITVACHRKISRMNEREIFYVNNHTEEIYNTSPPSLDPTCIFCLRLYWSYLRWI